MKPIKKIFVCTTIALFGFLTGSVYADSTTYADDYWLDWQENKVASFPDFSQNGAIEVEIDPHSQLRWFVDPKTIVIGKDSVVRYVVFAVSKSGTLNAMYEGLLCAQGTYKTYARAIGKSKQTSIAWREVENAQWKKTSDAQGYAHERILARRFMCDDMAAPTDVRIIIKRLQNPYDVSPNPARQ